MRCGWYNMSETTLAEAIDALPVEARTKLSHDYTKWHNLVIDLYKRHFGLDDATANTDPSQPAFVRNMNSEDEVIQFFRAALLWWYRRKPKIKEPITLLDALKTRDCLGQIQGLKARLEAVNIPIRKLKIDENLDK